MAEVIFRLPDGSSRSVQAAAGDSVMQAATYNDVPGILGRCGGFCNCGTCHVFVDPAWSGKLAALSDEEDALLSEVAAERQEHSRLSCQIRLSAALDGIVVTVPERQEFD